MSERPPNTGPRRPSATALARSRQLALARPLHAVAFGVAIATACGVLVFGLTAAECTQVVHGGFHDYLSLLAEFFPGYSVTWRGGLIGLVWGAAVGFAIGWGLAKVRNRMLEASMYFVRKRVATGGASDAYERP